MIFDNFHVKKNKWFHIFRDAFLLILQMAKWQQNDSKLTECIFGTPKNDFYKCTYRYFIFGKGLSFSVPVLSQQAPS